MPEPDLAVVAGRPEDYDDRHPDRAVLIVEVAATSLPQDRLTKQALHAAAGIGEYWIVNLLDSVVEVFRRPSGRGYATHRILRAGEQVSPLAGPGPVVEVAALLPGSSPAGP